MRYVIGLGTGRCGTASLAKLLEAQGANVGHEQAPMIPWADVSSRAVRWLEEKSGEVVGDVAHAWITLMPQLADHQSVRCVALWRPVEATVQSFCEHMPTAYIQTDSLLGALQFPTYDLPEREAWRRYVKTYHRQLRALESEGFVSVFPTDTLNSRDGQRRILTAAGFNEHTYLDGVHIRK